VYEANIAFLGQPVVQLVSIGTAVYYTLSIVTGILLARNQDDH